MGLESAGHYHRPLQARLEAAGIEVTLFNPAQVKRNATRTSCARSRATRSTSLPWRSCSSEARADSQPSGPTRSQSRCADASPARKIRACTALKLQIHAQLDLVFPGLSRCVWNPIESKVGPVMLDEGLTPERVRRLGNERFLRFCANRGVRVTRIKAAEIVACPQGVFALDATMSQVHLVC